MTCGALKQFNAELVSSQQYCYCTRNPSSEVSVSSVMGEGENCFCGSVIFNCKGVIVLIVKIKRKNTDTFADYSTCQPLEFSCLF